MTVCSQKHCCVYLGFFLLLGLLFPVAGTAQQEEIRPLGHFRYSGPAGSEQPGLSIDPLQERTLSRSAESLTFSLFDDVRYALEGNRNIEIAAYSPRQAEQDFKRYDAVYDPVAFAAGTISQVDRPIQSQLDTGSIFRRCLG